MKKVGKKTQKSAQEGNPIDQIDDFLFLGSLKGAQSARVLEENKIQHVLQLIRMDPIPDLEAKLNYLKIPIAGGNKTNIEPVLKPCLQFVHSCVSQRQNILVHCQFGRNRSASIVVAYVMACKNITCFEAERYVKQRRPVVEILPKTRDVLNRLGYRGVQSLIFN